jgi:hypothetical protein
MKKVYAIVALLCVTHVSACGGGGGGGGGGGEGSSTGVRVLHGAIDAVPVEVVTTGAAPAVVTKGVFGLPSQYARVSGGQQILNLSRATSPGSVISSFNTVIDERKRYSILLYGDNGQFGLRSKIVEDAVPETSSGAPLFRVAAAATGAATVRVSVGTSGTAFVVPFGEFSSYLEVSPGLNRIVARRAVDGASLVNLSVELQPGSVYTLLVAGETDYFVKGVVLTDQE